MLTEDEMAAFNKVLAPVVDQWIGKYKDAGFDAAGLADAARKAIEARRS